MTLCNPDQLKIQQVSQTSTEISVQNFVFDRESGKKIIIQYPSFDMTKPDEFLSFNKFIVLLKLLLIIQGLPQSAYEEAIKELCSIAEFYSDRPPQTNFPELPVTTIKGRLESTQVRPPIVVEP